MEKYCNINKIALYYRKNTVKYRINLSKQLKKQGEKNEMKRLTCEVCGNTELMKQDGVFVCQSCGTRYSVEEARKMMIEGSDEVAGGVVNAGNSDELANLYLLARRAKGDNNSENAQKYYEQIIVKDPSSWEANFYTTYYQSMNCKIAEIGLASARISNCEATVFNLIKEYVTDPVEQRKAVDEVAAKLISISNMLFNAYENHYYGIGLQIRHQFTQAYVNNCAAARDIVYNGGDWIVKIFGDTYGDVAVSCWKLGITQHDTLCLVLAQKQANAEIIQEYGDKIRKYEPFYQGPKIVVNSGNSGDSSSGGGGCYVATAVYGSYDCPQVWTLRRYRDYTLAETWYGRAFIYAYYAISPTLVKWFGHTEWFKKMWKGTLDRMVTRLNAEGVKNTPYIDKLW